MYRIQLKNIKKTRNHEAMAKTKKLTQKKRINKSKAKIYECCVIKKVTSRPLPMVFFYYYYYFFRARKAKSVCCLEDS